MQTSLASTRRRSDLADDVLVHQVHKPSALPTLLCQAGPLRALHLIDHALIEQERIYVAPPDCHLLVEFGQVHLSKGLKEKGTRPAIDPLFRSAAHAYGPRVVGVILTGARDDGTAGLLAVKRSGGVAIVQDPDSALFPDMPRSASASVTCRLYRAIVPPCAPVGPPCGLC